MITLVFISREIGFAVVPHYIERILILIYEISNLRNKGKNMNQNPLRLINEITM